MSTMPIVNVVRELFPMFYWSAGFIAVLFVVAAASLLLYVVTKWAPWILVAMAACIYMIPFISRAMH
jgi:hypothetical protein